MMLFTLQRYEFFSKSQLVPYNTIFHGWCCLPYKGTNFSANHNGANYSMNINKDVVYPTKVRIFQQITTNIGALKYCGKMLFTLQRYEFFSKSQLIIQKMLMQLRCCLPYKGTNFSANHNSNRLLFYSCLDVVYPTKVRIFQQITTGRRGGYVGGRCCLPYKGTNFSANHNVVAHVP